jgi:hypothetical protein
MPARSGTAARSAMSGAARGRARRRPGSAGLSPPRCGIPGRATRSGCARTRATRRQSLRAQERRLLDQERRLLEQGSHAVDRVRVTTAGTFWSRLNAIDFMNSSLQFAALAVLCLFPFLITVSAESGGDARHALVARLGLDQEAARDVDKLMSSGSHTVTTLSIVGAALVLLGALGIASTLQVWYERAYDQPPAQNLARQLANRLLWLGGLMGYLTLQDFFFIQLKQVGGARVPIYIATFILAIPFYWWTSHILLLGRVAWGSALSRRPRDGYVRDRSRCVLGPPLLTADRVERLGLRIDWRGDGAVVLSDRAWRLHPPGRCGGPHVGRATFGADR